MPEYVVQNIIVDDSPVCSECAYRNLFFKTLQDDQLNKISLCKNQQTFKKGEVICKEGSPVTSLIYLHKGLVKLHVNTHDGRSQIINIAKPFDFIGLMSLFANPTYKYSITAIEPCSVCFIDIDCIKHNIQTNGNFAIEIIEKMSKVNEDVLMAKFDMSKKNLRGRIASILVYFSDTVYNSNEFNLPVSRNEIAELIDMRTENVIRTFSEFRKDKIIKINGPTIEVINPDILRTISEKG